MEVQSQVEEQDENLLDAFPKEIREAVSGLIWLGDLEEEIEFCSHSFVIRTLKGDEELNAAVVCKEFEGTLGESKAFAWATVALALTSVDGDPDFCPPIGPNKKDFARARFAYCTQRWYWPLGDHLFQHYTALIAKQNRVMKAIQDLSPEDRENSLPSPDSSIDQGGFVNPPQELLDLMDETED